MTFLLNKSSGYKFKSDHYVTEHARCQQIRNVENEKLSDLLVSKKNSFTILSTNIESINAKFDELNLKKKYLETNGFQFGAICIKES